jgi:adenylate cyclase
MTRWMASAQEDPRVAMVDIDEDSLRDVGPWPWPRDRLADLAEQILSEAGASRVVFDMVLPQAAAGDERLAALAHAGALVLGQALDYAVRDAPVKVGSLAGTHTRQIAPGDLAPTATGFVGNHAGFNRALCVGNIGAVPDFDGQTRRLAPWTQWNGRAYPTLALAALGCAHQGLDAQALGMQLPLTDHGLWRVPFTRTLQSYVTVPARDVMAGTVDATGALPVLAGRMVVVGSSALGLSDRVATPLAPNVSGMTVHVAALSWMLDLQQGLAPTPPPPWAMPLWTVLSTLAIVALMVAARARLSWVATALAAALLGWLVLVGTMVRAGSPEPVSTAILAYGVVMLGLLPLEWSGAQGRLRRQLGLLGRYVAPAVLRGLLRSGDENPLAPRRAQVTVLIADMQDYTRNTADAGLEEAARLTKGFLQALTEPVLTGRGTLDRYTGDGLVAFWGAPIAEPDHADLAVEAALRIVQNVALFNAQRQAWGLPSVVVRIGLASGPALVGDLGTEFRISYTAVGDCINLASRLQQASREVDTPILASESVQAACTRHQWEEMGVIDIRGLGPQRVARPLGTGRDV